ncbi:GNAT family N-acetyltransferase [Roseateles cavernae]|uniref:GNAT family N-acetyltransferase n=1 Tax=Roseateles cavernae TaxID=3153578 RepID=UPI0032E4AB4C
MSQDPTLVVPAAELAPAPLHQAFVGAFADYLIGPFQTTLAQWPGLLARQGIDLGLSRVVLEGRDRQILAFAFVAPRPESGRWRLATMGALPAARGRGAAARLLDDMLARARAAGLAEAELEVFAQNERALRLYRGRGFETLHELHGYQALPGSVAPAACEFRAVEHGAALAWLRDEAQARLRDLPLQVTAASLQSASGMSAWQKGSAQLMFSRPDAATVVVGSLIDWQPAQTNARALLQALRAEFPQATLRVPQLQRLDLGGQALRELGFETLPLHQLLMRAKL